MERREFLKGSLALAAATQFPELVFAARRSGGDAHPAPGKDTPLEVIAYNRIAFGPRTRDIEAFSGLGKTPKIRMESLIESQLHPDGIVDHECEKRIAAAGLSTLNEEAGKLWQEHFVAAQQLQKRIFADEAKARSVSSGGIPGEKGGLRRPDQGPLKRKVNELRQRPIRDVEKATWLRAVYSERQLQELLVNFWHDHFNVFGWTAQTSPAFVSYDRDVIRKHAFGNFREMLEAVATSPAMLFYLDNYVNQSGNPNENYARELFELHTLGAENYLGTRDRDKVPGYKTGSPVGYVDGDVYEASRCFTGWRVETGPRTGETGLFKYFDPWHDRFQKIVLGHSFPEYQSPMKDGREVLDLLSRHPGTARFIARKLCIRFVSDKPSERLVHQAARVFLEHRQSKDQIRWVLREILHSPEFISSYGQKLKRPFDFVASSLRALDAEFEPTDQFLGNTAVLGQRLFQWRTPDGYPDARVKWVGSSAMLSRWRFCNQLAHGAFHGIRFDLKDWMPPRGARRKLSSSGLAHSVARRVLMHEPSAGTRRALAEFARPDLRARGRPVLKELLALVLMSPEFQWR